MSRAPGTSPTAPWDRLQRGLAGSFRARARGLTGGEFALLRPEDDGEFGRLRMRPPFGADLAAEGSETRIEREGHMGSRFRMTTDGAVVLIAGPEGRDGGFRIFCGGKTYGVGYRLLRNTATARPLKAADGGEEVRLQGGLAGRGYTATFPEGDGAALAVAVFLLYRNAALRRETF